MGIKPKLTETEFLSQVIQYAKLRGWRVVHFRPAKTSRGWRTPVQGDGVGWPDLFLIRGDRIIVAECKSDRGKLAPEQDAWLKAFELASVPSYLWRPGDWDEIMEVLR